MATGNSLTYQELYYNARCKLNLIWRIPPAHHWYTGTSPGFLLEIKCDHGSQTALARLTSGNLKFRQTGKETSKAPMSFSFRVHTKRCEK
ncbi:hypothetical protein TNCV_1478541 [Trichonephila clavipes]|nr:hypothetical protein TNCV_1478541 [Trichonephila clavipes]